MDWTVWIGDAEMDELRRWSTYWFQRADQNGSRKSLVVSRYAVKRASCWEMEFVSMVRKSGFNPLQSSV